MLKVSSLPSQTPRRPSRVSSLTFPPPSLTLSPLPPSSPPLVTVPSLISLPSLRNQHFICFPPVSSLFSLFQSLSFLFSFLISSFLFRHFPSFSSGHLSTVSYLIISFRFLFLIRFFFCLVIVFTSFPPSFFPPSSLTSPLSLLLRLPSPPLSSLPSFSSPLFSPRSLLSLFHPPASFFTWIFSSFRHVFPLFCSPSTPLLPSFTLPMIPFLVFPLFSYSLVPSSLLPVLPFYVEVLLFPLS